MFIGCDRNAIYFYNRDEPYYEFTNFFVPKVPIQLDGKQWKTTEHYFQAQKFIGTPYVEFIRKLDRPREAFEMSRKPSVARWMRKDWENVKCKIMYKALLAKFISNPSLRVKLASTGDRHLVEHSPNDGFWGDGYYAYGGRGKNMLGILLMDVRTHIKSTHKSLSSSVDPPYSAQSGDTNMNDISEESDSFESAVEEHNISSKGLLNSVSIFEGSEDQLPDISLDGDCMDDNSYYLELSQTDICYDENTC